MTTLQDKIKNEMPFISVIHYGGNEYVGIIINQDVHVTSFYDLTLITTTEEKSLFLEMGGIWWWESNRQIPINIFLRNEMYQFRYAIKTFNSKDVKVIMGHVVNLLNLSTKRIKRKSVQLIRHQRS